MARTHTSKCAISPGSKNLKTSGIVDMQLNSSPYENSAAVRPNRPRPSQGARFVWPILLAICYLVAVLPAPARAAWSTTDWKVKEEAEILWLHKEPEGDRIPIARKHETILKNASLWYQRLGFAQPAQNMDDGKFIAYLQTDTSNIGSAASSDGTMWLTSNPGFMKLDARMWELMEPSAVHEVLHSIQYSSPPFLAYMRKQESGPPACRDFPTADDWITEGTASYAQIRWIEQQKGIRYGHPFTGSQRPTWVRHFDQPLDWGSTPADLMVSYEKNRQTPADVNEYDWRKDETYSWMCSYGSWYFWYGVGEMLGGKAGNDPRRISYLRYIFDQPGPWEKTGLAMVDAGLKEAAKDYDAIRPYRDGLYSLYPQFVAQYLDADGFYEHLEEVTLGTPALYEATSSLDGEPIPALATRAWRFHIRLPENVSSMPHAIRFSLEVPEGVDRDALHLIVDSDVIRHPADPTARYSYTLFTDLETPNEEGEFEYLVRVANVAPEAVQTEPAEYLLRAEVEGFYGDGASTDKAWIDQVAGELPPGFAIRGPGRFWTCTGGSDARASFALMKPDSMATELQRMLPQFARNMDSDFDKAAIRAQDSGDAATADAVKQARGQFEGQLAAAAETSGAQAGIDAAAARLQQEDETPLMATFSGHNGDEGCVMHLDATLQGRDGGAQQVPGEDFGVEVIPDSMMHDVTVAGVTMRLPKLDEPDDDDWRVCDERHCNPGQLTLEHAETGHIAGSFRFDVIRDLDGHNTERRRVTGHFNVTSKHDDESDSVMDYLTRDLGLPGGMVPGLKNLLPGGSMLDDD